MVKKASEPEEVFLEHKRKKKRLDKKGGSYSFMLYARSLFITWGHREYWTWNCFKETGEENIEVAKLVTVCWLDVRGKFQMSELSVGVTYEVVYVVKLTKGASGWELPITLKLIVLGQAQTSSVRQVSILEKPRGQWFELNLGSFVAQANVEGEVCFDFFEHGGHWKQELIVKGAIIRPKT